MSKVSKVTKRTKQLIILRGLDIEGLLYKHYGDQAYNAVTLIEDVQQRVPQKQNARKNKRCMIFTNQQKNQSRMYAVMIDITQHHSLPRITSRPCWWCRTGFTSIPIGCPIKYNKNNPGTLDAERFAQHIKQMNLVTDGTCDFFETEGLFCSYSCAKSYALEELSKGKMRFKKSLTLLSLLRSKSEGPEAVSEPISSAPSWKMINEWGGPLSIKEFRDSPGRVEYVETVNVRRPMMYSTSQYLQEKTIRV